jgi:hypothetical protein
MQASPEPQTAAGETIHRGRIVGVRQQDGATECTLSRGAPVLVPSFLARYLSSGDEIQFPLGSGQVEIHVRKAPASRQLREIYQVPIGHVTQPKEDKRKELFVVAETIQHRLGIRAVHLPCQVLRDYFYVADRHREWNKQPTLYDVLGTISTAGPAELRLAFKIRQLELQKQPGSKGALAALERAYNIIAHPELRACYDALMKDPEAPVVFPYGGFGSLLVSGDRSRDGQTFFATRVLAFRPETQQRRFRAALRKFDFYCDHAIYRDARRKLELIVDQATMPLVWDQNWNQWKHLLGAKVEIDATFVQAGKYRTGGGEWALVKWESALPSRLQITLPANVPEQVAAARKTYHRFGQYSRGLEMIRARIEREPVEKAELERTLGQIGVPGDFDVTQITWQPDYDPFFYQQLAKRARRLYLFRSEFIFEVASGVVVETPQLGHATYLFGKPRSMESFLALYVRVSKEDIRRNREAVAGPLGFLGRIVHGVNSGAWLEVLLDKLGEPADDSTSR